MAGTLPGAPQGSAAGGIHPDVARKVPPVRCVQCRAEYELPQHGDEIACPECGNPSWVSTLITDAPAMSAHQAA
jgi:Zn finger protein HypA/HybF involved in hydrogenase expression